MDEAAATYLEVTDIMKRGDIAALEGAAMVIDGFPLGQNGYMGQAWINDAIDVAPINTIRWMVERGASLSYRADDGYTPLHSVIERETSDKYDILDFLIAAGADLNARGINDWTPLHLAAIRDDWKAMTALLTAGAGTDIKTRIDNYATAEEEARLLGHTRSADFIRDFET